MVLASKKDNKDEESSDIEIGVSLSKGSLKPSKLDEKFLLSIKKDGYDDALNKLSLMIEFRHCDSVPDKNKIEATT